MRQGVVRLFRPGERRETAPRRFIIGGLLGCGDALLLIGAPKSGKSAIAVAIASAISAGAPFFGRRTRAGAVIYVAAERFDESDMRLEVSIRDRPDVPLRLARARLGGEHDDADALAEAMMQLARDTGFDPACFILDTANAILRERAGDENSVRDIGRLTLAIDKLRSTTGAAVVLIHHSKRGEARARGSEAFEGWAETIAVVDGKSDQRRVRVLRSNTIDEGVKATFALSPIDLGEDPDTGTRSEVVVAVAVDKPAASIQPTKLAGDAQTAFLALKSLPEPAAFSEWREATMTAFAGRKQHAQRQAFSAAKTKLVDEGLIVIHGESVSVRMASA